MPGSDYYFVGGITELNYNIRSAGVDAQGGHTDARDGVGNVGGRLYVMNIALDFRLIDTRTLEVVDVISYQKQIIGREVRAGVFSFFDNTMLDIAGWRTRPRAGATGRARWRRTRGGRSDEPLLSRRQRHLRRRDRSPRRSDGARATPLAAAKAPRLSRSNNRARRTSTPGTPRATKTSPVIRGRS